MTVIISSVAVANTCVNKGCKHKHPPLSVSPVKGKQAISVKGLKTKQCIVLTDAAGNIVKQQELDIHKNYFEFKNLEEGLYFLELRKIQ
ncbi:MAG: hypothetical protein EOP51_13205 [Sphingobacteriales bacterium]|nr:MAG: hypothetical protein EOP51_13205 [Sphingobacteriales bacterium]